MAWLAGVTFAPGSDESAPVSAGVSRLRLFEITPPLKDYASAAWHLLVPPHVRDGRIDYDRIGAFRFGGDSVRLLDEAISALGDPRVWTRAPWTRADSIAFYINAYNAATVDLIVRERAKRRGSLKSIKQIPDAWSRPEWNVWGERLTLDQIEHAVLRKRWKEPRVHFALVCASLSCPALRPGAYGPADSLDAQLESAARSFLLDPTRNDFTPRDGRIRISTVFDWYGEDFAPVHGSAALKDGADRARAARFEAAYGSKLGAVLAYASRHLPAATVDALLRAPVRVEFLPYDWSLNIIPPREGSSRTSRDSR